MKWERKSKYCLTNGTHYLSRVNINETKRVYELWTIDGKSMVASRWCETDLQATTAVAELKELAK